MINIPKWLQRFFMLNTGYTYSNLSRLFLRLFTGVMFLQLGVRQITHIESFTPQQWELLTSQRLSRLW